MTLIYEKLTRELIGCFFDVHNSLGVGLDEKAYHRALERRLTRQGITYRSKVRKALIHRARKVREFEAELEYRGIGFEKRFPIALCSPPGTSVLI